MMKTNHTPLKLTSAKQNRSMSKHKPVEF